MQVCSTFLAAALCQPFRLPARHPIQPHPRLPLLMRILSDVIPAPRIAPSSIRLPSVLSTDQKAASVLLFQSLDAEADKAERASVQLQDTLSDFQTLLQPANLTQMQVYIAILAEPLLTVP